MDDLISRKALREAMYHEAFGMDSDMQKWDSGCWIRYKMFENHLKDAPSVPAVPLDKLCVWLARFGCPCEINEGMCDDAHGVDRCIGIFNSSAFCWQYWLTKMMEEQDAQTEQSGK